LILYQYTCAAGHHFEQLAEMSEFDKAVPCPTCGRSAARAITAPALNFRVMREQERVYHEHNVTHRRESETMTSLPNSPADQCQCGDCGSHRRRASITNVAEPGKEVFANG